MTKPVERGVARALRAEHGTPVKQLASLLEVSPGTVSLWVRDIEISPDQLTRNLSWAGTKRGETWSAINRERRRRAQEEGRRQARLADPLHLAGCMLYWAEGAKARNSLTFANSDENMMRLFSRFLRESLNVQAADFRIRLNVYTNNGLTLFEIEEHWLDALEAPRSCLRGHALNHYPTSTSGKKRSLPYGVCALRVIRGTYLLQHIYGAIQEYGRFSEPDWLDGSPRTRSSRQPD